MRPEEIAKKSSECLWEDDRASQWLGVTIKEIGPGSATLTLKVEKHHTNGHDICHGGIIYMLADSAFAFAANSYNRRVVAQHTQISYLRPVNSQETMTAVAREIERTRRSGIYDVTVARNDGKVVAEFRGFSREVEGSLFDEETSS